MTYESALTTLLYRLYFILHKTNQVNDTPICRCHAALFRIVKDKAEQQIDIYEIQAFKSKLGTRDISYVENEVLKYIPKPIISSM